MAVNMQIILLIVGFCCTSSFAEEPQEAPSTESSDTVLEGIPGNIIVPKPANCMPELQVVPFKETPEPSTTYFPTCVRIKRCGGCCNNELLSCDATATETRNYQIRGMKLVSGGKYDVVTEIVPLEEHTACKCDCKVKEKYVIKYWDLDSCSCLCREVRQCSTGNKFDENSCSCKREE